MTITTGHIRAVLKGTQPSRSGSAIDRGDELGAHASPDVPAKLPGSETRGTDVGPEIKRPSSPGCFGLTEIVSRRMTCRLLPSPQGLRVPEGDHGRCRPQEISAAVVGVWITGFAASATPAPCECHLEHRRVISLASDMQHLLPATMPNREFRSASRRRALRCLWVGLQPDMASTRFNPRPADWPGDAPGRAIIQTPDKKFQSAPGRLAGRCAPVQRASTSRPFQSAPGRLAGRCVPGRPRAPIWFQSAPGRLAGRCGQDRRLKEAAQVVSIRARPIGRAMRWLRRPHHQGLQVSIRARPIGRAMPVSRKHPAPIEHVSIRARPIGRAMLTIGVA